MVRLLRHALYVAGLVLVSGAGRLFLGDRNAAAPLAADLVLATLLLVAGVAVMAGARPDVARRAGVRSRRP